MVESHVTNVTTINEKVEENEELMTHSIRNEMEHNDSNHHHSKIVQINRDIMTRRIGYHSLLNAFIYSLTLIPLLFTLARTLSTWPHGFYYSRRYKRASVNELHTYTRLPLMNRDETKRFLSLFETTLLNKKIFDENCKKYYSCKVFQNAIKTDSLPKLSDFEWALLDILGIVIERYDYKLDLIQAVKMYYEIATNALKGVSCIHLYPCYRDQNRPKFIRSSQNRS